MKSVFLANSAWYLNNFRRKTLERFFRISKTVCIFPVNEDNHLLNDIECEKSIINMQAAGKNPLKELSALISIWIAVRAKRPDIVFSFNPKTNLYALIVCYTLRIPCVPNVSGVGAASQLKGLLGVAYNTLAKFFYQHAAHVYFQNPDDYRTFVERGWVLPEKAELIPGSGVDLTRFYPMKRHATTVRFLMAARLIKQKGIVEYLEAAKAVLADGQAVKFWLAGVKDHSSRAVEQTLIDQFSSVPGIEFLGHIEDMPNVLSQVDCVVLPSYYPEGIPRSLIEAAAAGKVIITTDTPGCREVVDSNRNGLLVAPNSVEALVDAMKKIISLSPSERSEMQAASRLLAESCFDESIVIESYVKVAERVTGQPLNTLL